MHNLNRIKGAREAASKQGSNSSSSFSYKTKSIVELKARGYFELPERKPRIYIDKAQSSTVDEESSSGDEHFWRKPTEEIQPKSPVIYDKETYMKFDNFSMMFHKNHSASKDISDTEFVYKEAFGRILP